MTKKLILATGNPGKLREIQKYLQDLDWELQLKPPELDIEETGATFADNACLKAREIALATGEWAIADDSGLAVKSLNGAPGVYSARYGSNDSERIARLLQELGDNQERGAQFVCVIAIARPDGSIVLQAQGVCDGEILTQPRGDNGFGYDPVFYVPEYQQTFAEMSPELKNKISHRGQAFAALIPGILGIKD